MKHEEEDKSWFYWLRKFFMNYFWLGVSIILASIVIDLYCPDYYRSNFLSIFIRLLEAIGISVLIASVFTFASGTSAFMGKIKKLLEDIVVGRNFLANIDPDSKREALKALIQPTESETNKYPNIGDYYGFFINKTLAIRGKSVRSNYQVTSRAYFDNEKKKVAVEALYSYRLYPSTNGFNDIIVGFEDKDSNCLHVSVSDPNGERQTEDNPELKMDDEGGDISYRATIPVKEFGDGKNHLDVELKVIEYGNDHWKLIQFKALQPTDGFKFHLHCEDNLEIKDHSIFVVGAKYYFDLSDDYRSVTVTCNQWVNEGTGLGVLVSIPHEDT